MTMDKSTPPREILNELPDYFLGCLIFYDEFSDDNMRWILYDGRRKIRCISRPAAEKLAAEIATKITDDGINHLMVAHHFLRRAHQTLDKMANESDVETRLWLQLKALEVRKIADAIDTLIAQQIKRTTDL